MLASLFGAALFAGVAIQSAIALPAISVKGSKFFANGQQFFLKGVAYQGTPQDPLYDTNQCQLDATAMQAIGTNSIRVYHVNPWVNHDGCMSAFSKAGIYVWLDLDTFNTTIDQTAPTWTEEQFAAFAQVMDVFQGYDNLAGFFIGNEVINTAAGSPSAPYIKAAVADMKSYMAAKKYRTIPIGYSAADIAELRPMLQNYLACGSHPEQAIDFFGLNSYEWCGDATYTTSGYANLQQMSETYNLPIFFSETGCNVPAPRTFLDQDAIFGSNMINTWSGSIIYEWVEETNHYGIVTYPNGQIYSGAPIPLQPDYNNLANVWKNINPTGVSQSGYTPNFAAPACPLATGGWAINGDVLLPTLGLKIVSAMAADKVALPSSSPTASPSTANTASTSAPVISSTSPASSVASSTSSRMLSTSQTTPSSATSISSVISSHSTGSASTSSHISTSTHGSTVPAGLTTTTSASPASTTSHSSAQKLLISKRSTDIKDYWSLAHMISKSGWLVTVVLPAFGVLWDFGHGAFTRLGIWGGGFGDMDEHVGDGGPACGRAVQLPFFNPTIKGYGKNSFRVRHVDVELGSIKLSEGNTQSDVDIVLRRMHDRKRRRRIREVPDPPPNSLRSLRKYVLTKKAFGEGRKRVILKGNGGINWGVDGWGMA